MNNTTLYDILEIPVTASQDEIKRAHRKLAMQYHPDKEGGDTVKMQEINKAYAVLKDPIKRKRYDTTGEGDSVDNSMSEIMTVACQILADIISKNPPDISYVLREVTNTVNENYLEDCRRAEKKKERLNKFKSRIVHGKENGFIQNYIDAELSAINERSKHDELTFNRTKQALEMFKEYTFTVKEVKTRESIQGRPIVGIRTFMEEYLGDPVKFMKTEFTTST